MHNRRKRRQVMSEINVVPYIDVMLVLLVIFMITAPLLSQGVQVNLPKASTKALPAEQKGPIIVSINRHGQYFLNIAEKSSTPIQAAHLINRIAAELAVASERNQNRSVLVKGDKDVDYGKVVRVMVLLQNAGVSKVGLVTEDPE